jgi:hypothetical protein
LGRFSWAVLFACLCKLLSACSDSIATAIPTHTPVPAQSQATTPTPTPPSPTPTLAIPTSTATATATATPTATATLTPTTTPVPTATSTPIPPTATPTEVPTPTPVPPTPTPLPPSPRIGATANGDVFAVTVHRMADPAPFPTYLPPKSGHRYADFDVTVTNRGDKPLFNCSGLFKLGTIDREVFISSLSTQKPDIGCGDIAPSKSARGWVRFTIPIDEEPAALLYEPIKTPSSWVIFALADDVIVVPPAASSASGGSSSNYGGRKGCGSRGGPGFRLPNGECAGWDDVYGNNAPSGGGGGGSGGCGSRGGPGGPRTKSGKCPSWR